MSKRILIVEDDSALALSLSNSLVHQGYVVEVARDGREALRALDVFCPEVVLLDLMLPDTDGFDLCRALSERPARPPIIIVSARSHHEDKVRGLDLGADDYVTKPFALSELLARIRVALRHREPRSEPLRLGDILVDFKKRTATRNGTDVGLTAREFLLLQYLAERPGQFVTRDELLTEVWGYPKDPPYTRSPDMAIKRLRVKIEPDPANPRYVRTAHGDGYYFTPD
jgi:two-component system, OmpR family, response regulator VicR